MKHFDYSKLRAYAMTIMACAFIPMFSAPQAPVGVKAAVNGTRVDLNWTNGDAGNPLLECGFEEESFPAENWETIVTNDIKYICSWFHFPGKEFLQTNNWEEYIHSGEKSAMMYFDDTFTTQDEWLITPTLDGASYLELYYYIDPTVLEYGMIEEFPDHYYVKASYDDGNSWETLWDARTDAQPSVGWHNLALPLKNESPVKVAFHGMGDNDQNVHFLWAVDDIKVSSSNSGTDVVEGYTIMLDGEILAEHVKSLEYSDVSPKEAGLHKYSVLAETAAGLSPAAEVEVSISEIELLPPTSLKVNSILDEFDGSYIISLEWEAPTGGVIEPSWYDIYCNGFEVGTMIEECSMEFSGYTKGVYNFEVTAVYQNPDGESESIGQRIAIDTRFNVRNLKATIEGEKIIVDWQAPEESEVAVAYYEVWRADNLVAEKLEALKFEDNNVPAGKYRYYVNTVYADGETALPAYIDVDNGDCEPRSLPMVETFDSCHLPADWTIQNFYDETPDNYLWQFDDPNGIGVTGEGFDKGFASIDCYDSGAYYLTSTLVTPPINIKDCDINSLTLSYFYDYASDGMSSIATVEIEKDGDGEWLWVDDLLPYEVETESFEFKPVYAENNLSAMVEGASTIRLRWNYDGMFDYHLAIDNVKVCDKTSGVAMLGDNTTSIRRTAGGIELNSEEGIYGVEIYSADGRLLKSVECSGDSAATVPYSGKGLCIVRVRTASSHQSVKLM